MNAANRGSGVAANGATIPSARMNLRRRRALIEVLLDVGGGSNAIFGWSNSSRRQSCFPHALYARPSELPAYRSQKFPDQCQMAQLKRAAIYQVAIEPLA